MAYLSLFLLSALVAIVVSSPAQDADKALRLGGKMFAVEDSGRVGGECTMEVPVTQKVVGECVKLGRFARGCVAGAYLEAYHQDCV